MVSLYDHHIHVEFYLVYVTHIDVNITVDK